MNSTSLEAKIEAILFWKGEPMRIDELARILESDSESIENSLNKLEEVMRERGIRLARNGNDVAFYTAPEVGDLIKKLAKEELTEVVSKAAIEVLSLVIYRGPVSKREIDYIRGVNSGYIMRNLMIRGLIERVGVRDRGSFIYQSTLDLLAHLGIDKKERLPDFDAVQKDIANFMSGTNSPENNNER